MDAMLSAIDRATDLLFSASEKVMQQNPSWAELPLVLTEDELRVFYVFVGLK